MKITDIEVIPLFPLSGVLLLPGAQLPLNIFEPRYLRMVDDALTGQRLIGMIQPRGGEFSGASSEAPALFDVGAAGRITSFSETDDGRYLIVLSKARRFRMVRELSTDTPYRQAEVDWRAYSNDEAKADQTGDEIDRAAFLTTVDQYLEATGLKADQASIEEAPVDALVASLAAGCPFSPSEKQALLEAETVAERAGLLVALMEMARRDNDETDMLQ